MCFLSPQVLASVQRLPIDAYAMTLPELRSHLVQTIELIDRQQSEKSAGDRRNQAFVLGHNLGTSIESAHEKHY